jgi:hypothetical protein
MPFLEFIQPPRNDKDLIAAVAAAAAATADDGPRIVPEAAIGGSADCTSKGMIHFVPFIMLNAPVDDLERKCTGKTSKPTAGRRPSF